MRLPLLLCLCFCIANISALGQQPTPNRSAQPALRDPENSQSRALTAPLQPAPLQTVPQDPFRDDPSETVPIQPAPESDSEASFNFDDPEPIDDLSLDSNQSFNFDEPDNAQFASSTDTQSSIASNSNFRGASPQMIGDFGGGSTVLSLGMPAVAVNNPNFPNINAVGGNTLSVPLPLAGGSRRIKIAENSQVTPLERIYGTFNYFHNSSQAIGTGRTPGNPATVVDSESLVQYTVGFEKPFYDNLLSVDVRMPFTGGIHQQAANDTGPTDPFSAFALDTGGIGNLSATLKAHLLQVGQTSISGGLSISIPTGSGVNAIVQEDLETDPGEFESTVNQINIDNNAVHLMPFVGFYRPIGDTWWLQAFTQIDTPTNGNDVRVNGDFIGRLTEQTLLYSDVSLGKWLYRNPCNSHRYCRSGVTGIASIFELHYTSSLNDADELLSQGNPGDENRFDVLNLTAGLTVEFSELWRINVAGAFPLREGRFDQFGGRQEDRFFDGEFSLQINRFF